MFELNITEIELITGALAYTGQMEYWEWEEMMRKYERMGIILF
jgi:hypothetical protein